jgi:hypothetical protein
MNIRILVCYLDTTALSIPVSFALEIAARNLKQTARAVVGDDLFSNTPRTADLVAVLAVQQIL